jgi:hypothetical protein
MYTGSGSGSGIESGTLCKVGSGSGIGSEKNHSGSTTLVAGSPPRTTAVHRSPNKLCGDLTPYLTYVYTVSDPHRFQDTKSRDGFSKRKAECAKKYVESIKKSRN